MLSATHRNCTLDVRSIWLLNTHSDQHVRDGEGVGYISDELCVKNVQPLNKQKVGKDENSTTIYVLLLSLDITVLLFNRCIENIILLKWLYNLVNDKSHSQSAVNPSDSLRGDIKIQFLWLQVST